MFRKLEVKQPNEAKNNTDQIKRFVDDFNDSSDDEDIVETNPYDGLTPIEATSIKRHLTLKRLKNINTYNEILEKKPETHQHLLNKNAIDGQYNSEQTRRKPSNFTSPLVDVSKILDAVPSNPENQENLPYTIIPSFRGLKWEEGINGADLFFSTRVHWEGEQTYSSKAFIMSQVDFQQHTKAFFLNNNDLVEQYKNYELNTQLSNEKYSLTENNEKLALAATKLKHFFELAEDIKDSFPYWKSVFPNMRDCKKLYTKDRLGKFKSLSLAQILSSFYVNSYSKFKLAFTNLGHTLNKLTNNREKVIILKQYFDNLFLTDKELEEGIAFLSEGQIPRHSLLYAFGLKCYTREQELTPQHLYTTNLIPEKSKVYLGKILVTQNPHTLFHQADKPVFIPHFDKKYGNLIDLLIIGEKEIQHQGANLHGKIAKSINIKLPKFKHQLAPSRYVAKYGIDIELYKEFKETFLYLITKNEHGRLSWMYLETILLAHLLHFHEIQLFKYCNKMADDCDKEINWLTREGKNRDNPFPK